MGRVNISDVLPGELSLMAQHLLVVTDPDLVEFFRVVGIDGQELDPFIQRKGLIHGFLKHPEIKREPADIPVDVLVFSHKDRVDSTNVTKVCQLVDL
jgi:hypothetical protein